MQADIKVLISRVAQNLRIQEIWHFKNKPGYMVPVKHCSSLHCTTLLFEKARL